MKIKHTDYRDPAERAYAEKREAAMREQRLAAEAVAARAKAFRAAVVAGDMPRAANIFLDEVGGLERTAFIRECEGTELLDILRDAKREFRDAVLAAHPNRAAIERELAPQKAQRLVAISRAIINGDLAHVSGTTERGVDDATYKRLEAAGIALRPWKGPRDESEPAGWYRWEPDDHLLKERFNNEGGRCRQIMTEREFLARVAFDEQFREQFTMGRLVAETISDQGAKLEDHKVTAALRITQ